ncbi:hypothetical protein BCR35DRAFT_295704 [Leucosporidium creatinivorum]|uniref:CRA domain-containing protein n=1 Tax=Leucosporidium creatinivorum TaxID=106004 RepID=A0A1Y2DJT5_9BASI|nr:hypothetical protein BCR35DRAFT_295704 [Leucosporidium creatinivorum]
MTSTPTTTSSTTVSASSYLHLAPASTPTHPSYTRDEIRQLVLEYLCSSCYADSAKAFVEEVDRREEEERQSAVAARGESGGQEEGVGAVKSLRRKESVMGMQGVEATPPPFASEPELDRDGMVVEQEEGEDLAEEREVERALVKSVAFRLDRNGVEQPMEDDEEDQGWSMLSRDQLNEVRLRRDIRDAILSGRIQPAVDLINEHFPSVLAEPTPSPSSTPTSSLKASKPCLPTTFFVSTPPSPTLPDSSASFSSNSNGNSPLPILGASFGPWSLSLEPQILALNLQLQTFVELMRVAHSPSSNASTPAGTSPLHPSATTTNGHSAAAASLSLADSMLSNSTSSLSSNTTTSTHTMNIAISQSQALNAKVQRLPGGKERDSWERECIDVSGLLAYKDLNTCPVRGYLAQERREVLAELVNAAILQRTDKTPLPLLSLAARQTTALWSTLAEWKVQFPPPPPGGEKDKSKEGKEKGKGRTYPRFDVRTFLNEREVPESSTPPSRE